MLENQKNAWLTFTAVPVNITWFVLLVNRGLIGGIIFNILDSRIEKYICLEMIPIRIHRIRIDMPWMPFRIRQNDEDPTVSGFTTLTFLMSLRFCSVGIWWDRTRYCWNSALTLRLFMQFKTSLALSQPQICTANKPHKIDQSFPFLLEFALVPTPFLQHNGEICNIRNQLAPPSANLPSVLQKSFCNLCTCIVFLL